MRVDSNFVKSYYGRNGFANFIDKNVTDDTFLYINEQKSRKLSNSAKVQFFGKLNNYDFDTIIRKTRANVKTKSTTGALYQERDSDGNAEKVGEAVNKPTKLDLKEAKAQAREPQRKDPTKLTEEDLMSLLGYVEDRLLSDDTYIPVRVNTPQILIAFAKRFGHTLENHPLAMNVYKARQALSNEENWDGRLQDKPHDLAAEEVVEIIKAMNDPSYLVFQTGNERFSEIVKFERDGGKEKAYAIIDFFDGDKNPAIMNGYKGGKYNILVTVYPSDNSDKLNEYLHNPKNKVITGEKMKKKGKSQGSYGSNMPSLLNDLPFFDNSLSHSAKKSQGVDLKKAKLQERDTAPTFYSKMGKVIDDNTLSKGQQEHSNAFAKNKDVRYMGRDGASSKSFNEYAVRAALWDALDHEDGRGDNLILVSDMPQYVKKLTGISGDFYIQRNHAYENMKSEDEAKAEGRYDKNAHYHSIDIDKMTSAMMSINSPIMSIATKTKHGNPAIIIILDEYGSNDAPLYAVLSFYSNKGINGDFSRKPHVVLTIAERNYSEPDVGRSGYDDIIRNAIEDGRVIDFDVKKEMICQ